MIIMRKTLLRDLKQEFPGDKIQILEIDKAHIKVREINHQAVAVLKNLIQNGLVNISLKPYEIEPG